MPTINARIISAEELGEFKPFALGALGDGPDTPLKRRAVLRPEEPSAPPPPPKPKVDMAALRAKAEAMRQQQLQASFDDGYREGYAAGEAAVRAEHEQEERALGVTLRDRVESLVATLDKEFEAFQATGADRLLDLALEIARQTVRHAIQHDRESMLAVVQEALALLHDESTPATLALHPDDVELVETHLAALLKRRQIEVRPDPAISMGGCKLVSVLAEIDATVETRWRRSLAALGRSAETEPLVV